MEIDLEKGKISNLTTGKDYNVSPHPQFMQEIIGSGGLINMVKKQLGTL